MALSLKQPVLTTTAKRRGCSYKSQKGSRGIACASDDPIKQKNLEEAQEVEKILGECIKKATDKGRKSKNVCINPKETDAFVHRGKRARGAIPAYVVGVLAGKERKEPNDIRYRSLWLLPCKIKVYYFNKRSFYTSLPL